jgi:hypothetical protein
MVDVEHTATLTTIRIRYDGFGATCVFACNGVMAVGATAASVALLD